MHAADTIHAPTRPSPIDRRSFLKTGVLAGGCAILTGIPLAAFVLAPAMKKGTGKWVEFGLVEDLEPDGFNMLSYEFMVKDGWLVLPQRGFVWAKAQSLKEITVFSSTCTHLACNVIWREDAQVFECPCHSGRFDPEGRPLAGPPTKPLNILEHKVEDDSLMVYLTY